LKPLRAAKKQPRFKIQNAILILTRKSEFRRFFSSLSHGPDKTHPRAGKFAMKSTVKKKAKNIPVIACFNKAKAPLGVDLNRLVTTLQTYVDDHLVPVWGTPAKLIKSTGFVKGAWGLVFLDNADQPGVTAYHDLTPEGMPLAKIFVETSLKDGDPVSVSASHELAEMLVDPATNMLAHGADAKVGYAYEVGDPVQGPGFRINGIPVSNFVYPAYFESFHKRGSAKFDHLGKLKRPFELLPGGYQITVKDGVWKNLYGSPEKKKRHEKQDRRDRRGDRRVKAAKGPLKHAHKSLGHAGGQGG
jgi:hypothetical protein